MDKKIIDKLRKYATEQGIDLTIWDQKMPHFGGSGPHRYQGLVKEYIKSKSTELVCTYCLRPQNLKE